MSKPGLRIYARHQDLRRAYRGLGLAIVSNPKGIMTSQDAWRQGLGGEVLCYVW